MCTYTWSGYFFLQTDEGIGKSHTYRRQFQFSMKYHDNIYVHAFPCDSPEVADLHTARQVSNCSAMDSHPDQEKDDSPTCSIIQYQDLDYQLAPRWTSMGIERSVSDIGFRQVVRSNSSLSWMNWTWYSLYSDSKQLSLRSKRVRDEATCIKSGTTVNRLDARKKYFNLQKLSVKMTPEFDIKLLLKIYMFQGTTPIRQRWHLPKCSTSNTKGHYSA